MYLYHVRWLPSNIYFCHHSFIIVSIERVAGRKGMCLLDNVNAGNICSFHISAIQVVDNDSDIRGSNGIPFQDGDLLLLVHSLSDAVRYVIDQHELINDYRICLIAQCLSTRRTLSII